MKKYIFLIFIVSFGVTFSQNNDHTIISNGITRNYTIHKPSDFNKNESYDLIFVLHGAKGTGKKLAKHSKFNHISNENNAIIVYPNGVSKSWADARNVSKASKKEINDVQFITDLRTEIAAKFHINRYYAVGISNGGFMVQTLACKIPGKFNAFASIISSLPENLVAQCLKKSNTPMLLMNGTKDRYVPFKGGEMPKFTKGGKISSTPKTITHWKNVNQVTKLLEIEKFPNTDSTDGSKVVKHTYYKNEKPQVVLYKIIGGGHGVPGNYTRRNPRFFKLGYVNQDINAEDEIWNFLSLH